MSKKNFNSLHEEKIALGKAISKLRLDKGYSLRKLAKAIALPPSNLTYIENGVQVPTSEVYELLLINLKPTMNQQREMDRIYSCIRQVPPPDVCKVILNNEDLVDKIRMLNEIILSKEQIEKIDSLFASFKNNT